MKKPYSLILAAGLVLAACQASKPKTTWQKVTETKPDKVAAGTDGSEAYTRKLHKVLTEQKVEHKVVTYQYRYQTRLRTEAVGTHSAVLYKNDSDPLNPWWLMDDRVDKPVWLPGQDVNRQVAFYLHRKAEILEQKEFSGEPQVTPTMIARRSPVVPAGEPAVTRIAKVPPAPARETTAAQTTAPAPFIRPARFAPATREMTIPFTKPAPAESDYDDVFRRAHGTEYDPSSPIDRRKMETLKQALLDTPAPTRTF